MIREQFSIDISDSGCFQYNIKEYAKKNGKLLLHMNKIDEWTINKVVVYFSYRFGK